MSTATVQKPRGRWSCPDARLILPADAPRQEWLAQRRKGIGGSDASTVAGVNPWESLYGLWLDKTGRGKEKDQTAAMRWGTLFEPALRQAFTEDTGIPVRRAGLMQAKTRPWQLVSVDGLTEDGGLFESKTTNWRLAEEWDDDQIADHAEVQVQHGLAVTGRSHAWVVCLVDGRDFQIRRVERDEELIKTLTGMEARFWAEHVMADIEPPVTWESLPAVKARYAGVPETASQTFTDETPLLALLDALAEAKEQVKDAEHAKADAEAKLRALIGDNEQLVAGNKLYATCKANGTFAATRFAADHPDLAATLTVPKPSLDVEAVKRDHPHLYEQYRARVLRTPKPKEI